MHDAKLIQVTILLECMLQARETFQTWSNVGRTMRIRSVAKDIDNHVPLGEPMPRGRGNRALREALATGEGRSLRMGKQTKARIKCRGTRESSELELDIAGGKPKGMKRTSIVEGNLTNEVIGGNTGVHFSSNREVHNSTPMRTQSLIGEPQRVVPRKMNVDNDVLKVLLR